MGMLISYTPSLEESKPHATGVTTEVSRGGVGLLWPENTPRWV